MKEERVRRKGGRVLVMSQETRGTEIKVMELIVSAKGTSKG